MKLTILRTDNVLEEFQTQFGDYPSMFAQLATQCSTEPLEIESVDTRVTVPEKVDADIYLITGSRHSVYEELEWIPKLVKFLEVVLAEGKKIIGICFGHQLMAHYFGGEVGPAEQGWAVGVHTSNIMNHPQWLDTNLDSVSLISSHKDQVQKLPPNAEVFLSNDFCPIAGFTMQGQVVTVQGHPEFSKDYSQALMTYRKEILGEAVYESGVKSLSEATHEHEVFSWLLEFAGLSQVKE